ncbi:MAG: hypothetical protein K0T00_578 [Gaiellaceae bacterium]|jgi:hypothetical protein|nr:hypothetical protein [Gaiellaceae bacterium]
MNPTFRRVALAAATLGLLLSLFLALRPDDEDEATATTPPPAATTADAATTTDAPATTEEPPPPATTEAPPATTATAATPAVVRIVVVGGRPEGGIRRASVRRGREVIVRVSSDVADHIHLHGYDLIADVAPGAPAELTFVADVPGRFEIELEDRGVPIADIQVRP